jgi:HPt (histidine-containing phosphotransfer) domain-containing protein
MTTSRTFNPETLLHYTEQDRELAAQLIVMGRTDIPGFLENAEELSGRGRYEEASRAIHSLKGVAGALGAERLYEDSLHCETMLKEGGDRSEVDLYFRKLRDEMKELFTDPDFLLFSDDRSL